MRAPLQAACYPDREDCRWRFFDSVLSPHLIRSLQEWEQSYYESLDADLEWKSPSAAQAFTAVGIVLAGQVANELGGEFAIEFASHEDGTPTYTAQSRRPANNKGASAAFANIASEMEAEQEHLARMLGDSEPGVQFTAVAPLSGEVVSWGDQGCRTDDAEWRGGAPGRT